MHVISIRIRSWITESIYKHQRQETDQKRVYILTRSTFAGQQRAAATTWSGDIGADWGVYKRQIPAAINHSMAGIPYWTFDIGAFVLNSAGGVFDRGGQDPAYEELYTRMFQFGAFCPIFRSHGSETPREIWRFGDFTNDLVEFDNLRYRLMPYIYSLAWQVTDHGYSIMRGLPMDFSADKNTYSIDDQFMFGPAIMVCPVTEYSSIVRPRPASSSRPINSGRKTAGRASTSSITATTTSEHFVTKRWRRTSTCSGTPAGRITSPTPNSQCAGKANWFRRRPGPIGSISRVSGRNEFFWTAGCCTTVTRRWKPKPFRWNSRPARNTTLPVRRPTRSWALSRRNFTGRPRKCSPKKKWSSQDRQTRPVYLPAGTAWIDFWTGQTLPGGQTVAADAPIDKIPLLIRAGSLIPMGPFIQYAAEKPADPIELRIYPGADGTFTLYEDENDNYDYEKGVYATIAFHWDDAKRQLTIDDRKGSFPGMLKERTFNIVLVGKDHGTGVGITDNPDKTVRYQGDRQIIQM